MSKTTKKEIPNYGQWSSSDLINETTRLALVIADAENRGWEAREMISREQYHTAMAALIDKVEPFDPAAAKRAGRTRLWHIAKAAEAQRERLGLAGDQLAGRALMHDKAAGQAHKGA